MPKNVLIIEDDHQIQKALIKIFHREKFESVSAFTPTEAQKLFYQHRACLKLIIIDGNLVAERDTLPLVTEFRPLFSGTMIAISANEDINQELMAKGCDLYGTKPEIIDPIIKALEKLKRT